MSTPSSPAVDPRLVTALSAECESIGLQLRHLGQNLLILQSQLASGPAPVPAYVSPPVNCLAPPQQVSGLQVPGPQYVRTPSPARPPWWQRDGVVSRLLAIAGAGVTLIGIVMLLVLAAQAGFFGPPLRVAGGAALSGALIVAGFRVISRPGGRVGAIALAATGFAGLYLNVLAASVLYGWIITPLAVVIAFGIGAAGVAVAVTWNSEPLALLTVLGAAAAAPALTGSISMPLIGFLLAIQLAGFSAQLGRDWKYLGLARTVPVVFALLVTVLISAIFDETYISTTGLAVSAILAAVIGVSAAVTMQQHGSCSRDGVAGAWSSATFVIATLPVLSVGALLDRLPAALLYGATTLLFISGSAIAKTLSVHLRLSIAGVGALALLLCCVAGTPEAFTSAVLLLLAALFLAVSFQTGSRFVFGLGSAFATIGLIGYLLTTVPSSLMTSYGAAVHLSAISALTSLTAIVAITALGMALHRLKLVDQRNTDVIWAIGATGILYGVTCALVASGIEIWGGTTGFVLGHSAATVVWMLAATSALMYGLNSERHAHLMLGSGLTLTCAALAKLFLFDLAALNGLVRGIAFLAVGLLLLLVGTRYARAFGKQEQVNSASAGPEVR